MTYIIAAVVLVVIGGMVAYTTTMSTPDESTVEAPATEVIREVEERSADLEPVVAEPEPEPVTTEESSSPVTDDSTVDTVEEVVPEPEPEPVTSNTYEDGSYTATVSYRSPGGNHGLTVDLEIENDQVVDTDIEYETANGTSRNYLQRFEAGYQTQVVGQSLATVNVSRVGGASLTATAFNKAVAEIKADAQR